MNSDTGTNLPIRPRRGRRAFTMVELLISTTIGLTVTATVVSFVIMVSGRMKSAQNQLTANHRGRFGGTRIANLIRNARVVAAEEDGNAALIANADRTISLLYFDNPDDNLLTIEDNNLMYDPDIDVSMDETVLIPRVSPLENEPIFSMVQDSLAVRFHTGDAFPSADYDHLTGKGYQGIQIRVLARPRNVAQIWTRE